MKKGLLLLVLLAFTSASFAAEFSAKLNVKTGDSNLDLSLSNINTQARTSDGAKQVRADIRQNYSLSDREINFLSKQGYTLAEITYLASLAKAGGKTVTSVAALRSQGVGWGVLAKRLGVRPDALRKLIVREKKAGKIKVYEEKAEIKGKPMLQERQEKQERQMSTPSTQREHMNKSMMQQRGTGGGHGKVR